MTFKSSRFKVVSTALFACVIGFALMMLTAFAQRPRIQFAEEVFDFGPMQQGEKLVHIFTFSNVGDAPLSLFDTWGD